MPRNETGDVAGATERQRALLLEIYRAALEAVNGRSAVRRYLSAHPLAGPVHLVAMGKAAAEMARGAVEVLGDRIAAGLVLTKTGHCESLPFPCLEGGHPVPDRGSLDAGQALLAFLRSAPQEARFLFLISGGASAVVDALPAPLGIEEWQRVNRWLLGSGLPITAVNRVRRRLSRLKGGRLAALLAGRPALQLLISDVEGDDPAVIASGPLVASPYPADGLDDLALPEWLRPWLELAPPMPAADDPCFHAVETALVARLADALEAAARAGAAHGLAVHGHREFLAGEAAEVGVRLAEALARGEPGLHLWGGETTVTLPPEPGQGGRCQQLALAAATVLGGRADCALLAAGTDGTDGPGSAAGALVDSRTVARGETEGFDARRSLDAADAGSFLAASGDLIETGPTGTNVMDLILGLKGS